MTPKKLSDTSVLALADTPQDPLTPESRLSATHSSCSSLIDLAPALLAYIDATGTYREMSKQYEAWCGVSRQYFIGKHFSEVIPALFGEEYFANVHERVIRALTGESVRVEGRMGSTSQSKFVKAYYSPDVDVNGVVRGIVVMVTDVTEVKLAEKAAQDAQDRLALAAEASGMAVWDHDVRSNALTWDKACFKLLGLDPELGKPSFADLVERIHPEDAAARTEARQRAEQEDSTYEAEYRAALPDGTWRWISSRGRFFRDEHGKVTRVLGVAFDISARKRAEERAIAEGARVLQILESTTDGVFMVDRNWNFTYLNTHAAQALGKERDLLGKNIWSSFPAALTSKFHSHYHETMLQRTPTALEEYYPAPLDKWFEVHAYPADEGLIGFFRDITDRKRAEETLLLHRQALEAVPVGISIAERSPGKDYPLVYINPAFEKITGYRLEEVVGKNCRFLQGSETRQKSLDEIRHAIEHGSATRTVIRNYTKDGAPFLNELQLSPVRDTDGKITHLVGIQTDVTERVETRERLARQAQYDALTEIPNRYLFMDRLQDAMRVAARFQEELAIVYVDVDNLKHVNDSLGHAYGDRLLKEVAQRIVSAVRSTDTVARLGGDEFALFCTIRSDGTELEQMMNRIIAKLAAPLHLEEHELVVTGSAGSAVFPKDGLEAEDLLRMADVAMYKAKREGKNAWRRYQPSLDQGGKRRLDVAAGLRRALREQQFFLDYQPRVDAKTGCMTSMEALIRWRHPVYGVLPPGRFISVAEETGLINEIGRWVLGEALRQMRAWQTDGLVPVPISINVSPIQFRNPSFAPSVIREIEAAGVAPSLFEIEVTESMLMDDSVSGEPLNDLRSFGLRISIDDFGTGYSGLGYLTRFPVDTLKIDRSFTERIAENNAAAAICESIIQLTQKLHLTTVAEGIESEAQAALLREWGCNELQGYHLGPPMPPQEIAKMLSMLQRKECARL